MAKCPLCSQRAAKRHCPAKARMICPVCCGTKREIEIDCPSDCRYLRTGLAYESQRQGVHRSFPGQQQFNEQFFYRQRALIAALAGALLEERRAAPQLVDEAVRIALKALQATLKTLDAGIYYETLPDGGAAAMGVYRRLKATADELMQPQSPDQAAKVTDVLQVLDFMMASAQFHSGDRPRSRRYLEWLQGMVPESGGSEPSRLIVP